MLLVVFLAAACTPLQLPPAAPEPTRRPAPAGLPTPSAHVTPAVQTFHGCPPGGSGGDRALNHLKNRIDEAPLTPVQFATVLNLPWPKGIERRQRVDWSTADVAAVKAVEEVPLSIEGYLWGGRQSGPESTNCNSLDDLDWHVWLVEHAGDQRDRAIVVEPTPRTQALHTGWTLAKVSALAKAGTRVRVTGWLFLDPEHPDQVGKTRGTIWEIHPVTGLDVQSAGGWVKLDDYKP